MEELKPLGEGEITEASVEESDELMQDIHENGMPVVLYETED